MSALCMKSSLRCGRRRQNLGKWLTKRMLNSGITFWMHYLNLVHRTLQLPSLRFTFFYIPSECARQRCINTFKRYVASKDLFQQMLWHGVLYERASLGCFLEWQRVYIGPWKRRKPWRGDEMGDSIHGDHSFHLTTHFPWKLELYFNFAETLELDKEESQALKTFYLSRLEAIASALQHIYKEAVETFAE